MAQKFQESQAVIADRKRRIQWWTDARFGMFVHYGLYAQLGRGEWVMNRERIPWSQYEPLARTFAPNPGCTDEWCWLAKRGGMKYITMTTKHHEGFSLWDSKANPFNSVNLSPGRDIVAEFVASARRAGLGVGLYYSLMDWRHSDGVRSHKDAKARRRLIEFTQGCVRELMSHYGKIDILWYDVLWPSKDPKWWEIEKMNAMVRRFQPDILLNNRGGAPEDFGTPEGHISPAETGRAWESCMTFNEYWGYCPTPSEDWKSARDVIKMLRQVTAGAGNLLLNIGPAGDGLAPREAHERLAKVGAWLKTYGSIACYGQVDRVEGLEGWPGSGWWTRKGKTHFYWVTEWPGEKLAIGGLKTKVKSVSLLPQDKPLRFEQSPDRLVVRGLPKKCPDKHCGIGMLKIVFAGTPRQILGEGMKWLGK